MSPTVMSRAEVRDVDRRAIEEFSLPGIVLMENAGRGCVDWLVELGVSGRVVICAGKGNNGGDGSVIARHLANRGLAVTTLLVAEPEALRGDAAINFQVLVKAGEDVLVVGSHPDASIISQQLETADWIIDALLGTGTQGALQEPYPTVIRAINASKAKIFAIDLPSGMDCDTGAPVDASAPLCVRADYTATFVARKLGFENPRAAQFTGEVRVIDIGVPRAVLIAGGR